MFKSLETKNALPDAWLDGTSPIVKIISATPSSVREQYLFIKFQDGPIADVGVNGVCMLDVAQAMIDRLEQFESQWPRLENKQAILKLKEFQFWLKEKRDNRKRERCSA